MTDKKIKDLIYRSLEKELTPEEQQNLDRCLATHPGAARLYKEWDQISDQVNREKENLVNIDLKQAILSRIDMKKYAQQEAKPEIRITTALWHRPQVRYGFYFLMGVFAGFLLFSFLKVDITGSKVQTQDMKGTLYDSRSFDDMKVADNILYESPLARAVFAVRYSTKIVEARIDLSSLYPIKTTVEFDFNNFEVLNVQNVSVNDQTTAMAASNFLQINNVGDNKFIVQLYNKNSLQHNIDFKIYQNDLPLYQNSVTVNKE